jgi:aspartate/methionine/tyrosine aminotransferase
VAPVDLGDALAHRIDREVSRRLRAGHEVLRLHVGDTDLETPQGIREAAERALAEGRTHYAPPQGSPRLRAAIAERWAARHQVPASAETVVVAPTKFAIFAAIAATIDPGDEVLFADPSYLFEEPIRLCGGRPVRFGLRDDHSLDLDDLAAAITPRTRLLLLVTPGNPTGRVLRKEELRAAATIAAEKHLVVLSDEAYSELVYDGTHVSTASVSPSDLPVITLGSFSKTYAMSGWRAGFAIAPPELTQRIVRVVEHTLTCLPPFVQDACLWALVNGEPDANALKERLRERRDELLGRLGDLAGLSFVSPDGALYVFPRYELDLRSEEFALKLLEEEGVAVAPGAAFGPRGEGHLRIAFSLSPDRLDVAAQRLGSFLERHGASRG